MTEWFVGMLAIASAFLCAGLIPIVHAQLLESVEWSHNKAMRISAALVIHASGVFVLLSAAFFGQLSTITAPMWLTWAAFGLWLTAKTMIISVTGWFKTCLILYAAWSGFCVFAVTQQLWS